MLTIKLSSDFSSLYFYSVETNTSDGAKQVQLNLHLTERVYVVLEQKLKHKKV